jgi:hypothetical protein
MQITCGGSPIASTDCHARRRLRVVLAAAPLAIAALVGAAGQLWADGAVAVGTTGNVVADGIAFGMVVDVPKATAAATAVQRCRTFHARAAADRCKVVATFSGACFAVAYDPKPGTPGAGWGVGPDQDTADAKAIAMCEAAAGSARKGYCRVETGGCDTTGQTEALLGGKASEKGGEKAPAERQQADPPANPPAANPPVQAKAAPDTKPARTPEAKAPAGGAPFLPLGTFVIVAAAYAMGQLVRGKLKAGFAERQILTGGGLAVGAAVAVKLLDMTGIGSLIELVLTGLAGLAIAVFA